VDLSTGGLSGAAKRLGYEGLGKALDMVSTGNGILDVIKGVSDKTSILKKKDQSIQITVPGTVVAPSAATSGGGSYVPVSNSQKPSAQSAQRMYGGGGVLTPAQSAALSNLSNAFTTTNAAQAAAVQNVIRAFTRP
jgi:hypothetical protein